MYARVSTFEGTRGTTGRSIADVREHVLPACEALPGFEGMVVLADDASGRSLAITFWESEGALKASEDAANAIRGDAAGRQQERVVGVERFEVPLATLQARLGTS